MPEDDADLRKKVRDVWGGTLTGVELPGQSIKPAAATQTVPAPGAEPLPLPTVPLSIPEEQAAARAAQIAILDVIGEGGMGTIYRARQKSLDREVALKRIKPHLEMRQDVVDMFLGEAHATGALDHPNIVPVHELGRDDEGLLKDGLRQDTPELRTRLARALARHGLPRLAGVSLLRPAA